MSMTFAGRDRRLALYRGRGHAVAVDTRALTASVLTEEEASARAWKQSGEPDALCAEVAEAAVRSLQAGAGVLELENSLRRGYTVPRRVRENARAALAGDLSPMSRLAASLLAAGGQVSCPDVLWVHRFFQAQTADQAGPEKWAAWGGTEGRNWAAALANKLEYDSVTADAGEFSVPGLRAFTEGDETTRAFWGGLVAAGRADSVFMMSVDGGWLCWANGDWARADGPPRTRVELDDESALYVAGALLDSPDRPVDLRNVDPGEWLVAAAGLPGIDWAMVERVMTRSALTAAGEGDGEYTPEERSKNASGQLRDANGRFAQVGDEGLMKTARLRGRIESINPQSGQIVVAAEDGKTYMIDPKDFEIDGGAGASTAPGAPDPGKVSEMPDFSKILGQPRATATTPKGFLKHVLQPMGPKQLKEVVDDYEGFVNDERQRRAADFRGGTGWRESAPESKHDAKARRQAIRTIDDFYEKYGSKKQKRKGVTAAGEAQPDEAPAPEDQATNDDRLTPDTSDVPPLHLAIVDRDDPRAVMELVAMIPAGPSAPTATTFKRSGGEWVEAPEILQDLRSPTPPPVVTLDDEDYQAVLDQVDSEPSPEDAAAPDDGAVTAALYTEDDMREAARGSEAPCAKCGETLVYGVDGDWWSMPDGSIGCDEGGEHEPDLALVVVPPPLSPPPDPGYAPVLTLVSAGGADRNRGGAEQLRRYWTVGEGGLKIRWNTDGDWRRCVRYLSKHLGPRSKGYCALRHHEMTGMWPGDRRNRKEYAMNPDGATVTSLDDVRRWPAVIRASAQQAAVEAALAKVRGDEFKPVPVSAADIDEGRSGRAFKIPHVVVEGLSSGDKRHFRRGSLGIRNLPLPLMWQEKTAEGHDNAVIVGRIDHVERTEDGLGNAYGVLDTGPYGREFQRLVESGMLRWISVDLDKFEVDEAASESDPEGKMHIRKGRMMGATGVAKPAFQECTIELLPLAEEAAEDTDTSIVDNVVPSAISASAAIAASIPVEPPAAWFDDPGLVKPTPIQVADDGRVFGHIATWHTSHIGLAGNTRPPRSYSGYQYFHTGVVRTGEGQDVRVGQLTLAGGHADLRADAAAAVKHYDDTASAVADVHAGEDSYGIWVAGALRPGTTPEQIRVLRASAPSGDWRSVNGGPLELVAVCQVNVPGFPVPRSLAASGAQHLNSLVAAGTADLIAIRAEEAKGDIAAMAASARSRIFLALDVDGYLTEFKSFPADKRDELAKKGHALPDGSFPIENAADLRRAVQAYGRADESKKAKVRRHIVKRARALGKPDAVPKDWKEASYSDRSLANRDKYDALVASARQAKVQALVDRVNRPSLAAQAEELRKRVGR